MIPTLRCLIIVGVTLRESLILLAAAAVGELALDSTGDPLRGDGV